MKTQYQIAAVQFSNSDRTYYFKTPTEFNVGPGDRVIAPNKSSFTIPTVVGVYPSDSPLAKEADLWLVQRVDTRRIEEIKREEALDAQ